MLLKGRKERLLKPEKFTENTKVNEELLNRCKSLHTSQISQNIQSWKGTTRMIESQVQGEWPIQGYSSTESIQV